MPTVALDRIKVGLNRRPLKEKKVAELMESIEANGLLNPITIDREHNLIAGLHRLTACKLLGLDRIECKVLACENSNQARLAEIDENLIRSELDVLERAQLWLERDRLLEEMGLRAQPGDNQHTQKSPQGGGETNSPPPKTTFELAQEVGYTKRTYQQGKQIARSIAPEVQVLIKGNPLAKSTTTLLKIARIGSVERQKAEAAERAALEAEAKQQPEEAKRQAQLAARAREKQTQLQLAAFQESIAQREAKQVAKKSAKLASQNEARASAQSPVPQDSASPVAPPQVRLGEEWMLNQHLVYCGDTASADFINRLPSDAALALAVPSATWDHDYLINEARVVAVLHSEGNIHEFCRRHRMPFQFELILGNLYLAVFSRQPLAKPTQPITVEGLEGIVAYLVSAYTHPGNFTIAPFLGQGEVLMACEKMGRICFAGDPNPKSVIRAMARWQAWTGKSAQRMSES
jgi:ParB family chromosome partitioning protein